MRKFAPRCKRKIVDVTGYVDLPTACLRANETGFFGLSQRVNPESFDSKDTNIDPRECFFGGRRIDLAVQLKNSEDLATKSVKSSETGSSDAGTGTPTVE